MLLRQRAWPAAIAIIAFLSAWTVWAAARPPSPSYPGAGERNSSLAAPVAPATRSARLAGRYAAIVTRVIDGDTVEARVAIWLGQDITTKVRLRGVDAPEINGACGSERDAAIAARDRLQALIAEANGSVTLAEVGGDKYFGRVVADLLIGGINSGGVLLAEGLARPYGGGRRDAWCGLAFR